MNNFYLKPKFFSVIKNYSGKQFVSDVIAGIIVAIIALPLSIALALASGVALDDEDIKYLILHLGAVNSLDSTAMNAVEALYDKRKDKNIELLLAHVEKHPLAVMKKYGFFRCCGRRKLFRTYFNKKNRFRIEICFFGGASGTRTPDRPVMSR